MSKLVVDMSAKLGPLARWFAPVQRHTDAIFCEPADGGHTL